MERRKSPPSTVDFVEEQTRRRVRPLVGARVDCSSHGLKWEDVLVETGQNGPWEATDLIAPNHYLCFNRKPDPVVVETKLSSGFRRVTLAPGSFWACSAGDTFTHRVSDTASYGILTITPARLALAVGAERVEIVRSYGTHDRRLRALFEALVCEAEHRGENGAAFTDAVVTAISAHILRHLAAPVPGVSASTHRPGRQRFAPVLDRIEDRLAGGITLAEMASMVELSPFHFAREFRLLVGLSPHQYLLRRRLERARDRIRTSNDSLARIALDLGFADQSHLSRLFKRRFGVPPRVYRRETRR